MESKTEKIKTTTINKKRVRHLLTMLKGAFEKVPLNVAPNKDRGIYFQKAMQDLKQLIDEFSR